MDASGCADGMASLILEADVNAPQVPAWAVERPTIPNYLDRDNINSMPAAEAYRLRRCITLARNRIRMDREDDARIAEGLPPLRVRPAPGYLCMDFLQNTCTRPTCMFQHCISPRVAGGCLGSPS